MDDICLTVPRLDSLCVIIIIYILYILEMFYIYQLELGRKQNFVNLDLQKIVFSSNFCQTFDKFLLSHFCKIYFCKRNFFFIWRRRYLVTTLVSWDCICYSFLQAVNGTEGSSLIHQEQASTVLSWLLPFKKLGKIFLMPKMKISLSLLPNYELRASGACTIKNLSK